MLNDQNRSIGEGMTKRIHFVNENYCPVKNLKIGLLRNLKKGKIYDLSDKSVALIIKKFARIAVLNETKYSGHSLRSGFTTAQSGAEEKIL